MILQNIQLLKIVCKLPSKPDEVRTGHLQELEKWIEIQVLLKVFILHLDSIKEPKKLQIL